MLHPSEEVIICFRHHMMTSSKGNKFRRRWKKKSKLRVTGICAGNSSETGQFPAQRTSNAENVSISWRHHNIWALRWIWTDESHSSHISQGQSVNLNSGVPGITWYNIYTGTKSALTLASNVENVTIWWRHLGVAKYSKDIAIRNLIIGSRVNMDCQQCLDKDVGITSAWYDLPFLWHSPEGNFTVNAHNISPWHELTITTVKSLI